MGTVCMDGRVRDMALLDVFLDFYFLPHLYLILPLLPFGKLFGRSKRDTLVRLDRPEPFLLFMLLILVLLYTSLINK